MSVADRELDNSFDKESRDKNSVLTVFHASRSSSSSALRYWCGSLFRFKRECLLTVNSIVV
ncbi:hypothetical protein IMY05_002G0117600 [Salix suchowensis]|nr:hypothetical protein IMY05_002G0117600 [Salix suchowensis]